MVDLVSPRLLDVPICTTQRNDLQAEYVALEQSSTGEGDLRSTLDLNVSFSSSPAILQRSLTRAPSADISRLYPYIGHMNFSTSLSTSAFPFQSSPSCWKHSWNLGRNSFPFNLKELVQSSPVEKKTEKGFAVSFSQRSGQVRQVNKFAILARTRVQVNG